MPCCLRWTATRLGRGASGTWRPHPFPACGIPRRWCSSVESRTDCWSCSLCWTMRNNLYLSLTTLSLEVPTEQHHRRVCAEKYLAGHDRVDQRCAIYLADGREVVLARP